MELYLSSNICFYLRCLGLKLLLVYISRLEDMTIFLDFFSNLDVYALREKYQEKVQVLLSILSSCSTNAWMPWGSIISRLIIFLETSLL